MKKLLTIALALVMVLALAVPAFAIYGWEAAPATESTLAEGFTLTLSQYEYIPATTGFDWMNNYYTNWAPTTGVVAGSNVRFVATVDAIAYTGIQKDVMKDIASLKLTVSSSNLYIYKAEARRFVANSTGVYVIDQNWGTNPNYTKDVASNITNKVDGSTKFSWKMGDITTKSYAAKVQVMFEASVKSTADATVSATLSCGASAFDDNGMFKFAKNGKDYTVKHDGNYFYVWNDTTPLRVVRFTVDSANKVTDIHVSLQDLLDAYVTSVTPLTNQEQAALVNAVNDVYVDIAMLGGLYSAATSTDYMPLAPYYIAYELWVEYMLSNYYALSTSKVYWTTNDGSYDYDDLTSAGLSAFETYIGSDGLDLGLSVPNAATLRGLGISYVLDTLGSTSSYAASRAKVFSKFGKSAHPAAVLADYAGVYAAITNADVLQRAVINDVMAAKGYVYFVNEDDYLYDTNDQVWDYYAIFSLNGSDPANILGQIGKLSTDGTVVAKYYRASYNVNTATLTFGTTKQYLDGGYEKIWASNSTAVTGGKMNVNGFTQTCWDELMSDCNANAYAPANLTDIEVYAQIDADRLDSQFVIAKDYIASGSTYNYLKDTFTEITGVLGFNWDGTTSYMYEDAFLANFAAKLSIAKSVTYTAYAAQLVVADPNAQPPQTGDASSVLGFVMIALAVVAAGAVVVKKVRA